MRLVIIGSGNVANVLGKMLFSAGHELLQVIGRNRAAVEELAAAVHSTACFDLQEITLDADVYILAVTDSTLYQRSILANLERGVLVHTAGSVPMTVLKTMAKDYGVFYPLQTMRKGEDPGPDVPILINGNSVSVIHMLSELALTLSQSVTVLDDEQRGKIHLAATIVNNFSNHLFALANEFCVKQGLDWRLMAPLITHTAEMAAHGNPSLLQTGPAARKDFVTMERHENMLTDYAELKKIYGVMSKSLVDSM